MVFSSLPSKMCMEANVMAPKSQFRLFSDSTLEHPFARLLTSFCWIDCQTLRLYTGFIGKSLS